MDAIMRDAVVNVVSSDGLTRLGTALADGTRREILRELLQGPSYPAHLARSVGTSRANISNHLSCLRGCGLVTSTPEGRRVRYELVDQAVGHHLAAILDMLLPADPDHRHLG